MLLGEHALGHVIPESLLQWKQRRRVIGNDVVVDPCPHRSVNHVNDANDVEFVASHQKGRMRRKHQLIVDREPRKSMPEFPLFESVEAETGLIEQQNCVYMLSRSLGEEHDEERNQPLESF